MRQVHVLTHLSFVLLRYEFRVKFGVNWRVQIRYRMLELAQDWTAINVMKHMVVIVGLVRKPLVIQKDICKRLHCLAFGATQTGVTSSACAVP